MACWTYSRSAPVKPKNSSSSTSTSNVRYASLTSIVNTSHIPATSSDSSVTPAVICLASASSSAWNSGSRSIG
eukprot:1505597-Rhodomonas_salina.1